MTTGEKITYHRKKLGMTQQQFADSMGVSRQAVSRWEGDLAFPETETLLKMSAMFGCTVDYLLKYNESDGRQEGAASTQGGGKEEQDGAKSGDGGAALPSAQSSDENSSDGKSATQSAPRVGSGWLISDLSRLRFEYKSKTTLFGVPLVHINIGIFAVAKGIIAIGPVAIGFLSFGLLGVGFLALSCLALGVLSLGALSMGVLSLGGVSVGIIAMGGLAVGLYSFGGCSIGLFAAGGYANGRLVAVGDYAVGEIAFGKTTSIGSKISVTLENFEELKESAYSKIDALSPFWNGFKAWIKRFAEIIMRQGTGA